MCITKLACMACRFFPASISNGPSAGVQLSEAVGAQSSTNMFNLAKQSRERVTLAHSLPHQQHTKP